jgi:hypothetical protein
LQKRYPEKAAGIADLTSKLVLIRCRKSEIDRLWIIQALSLYEVLGFQSLWQRVLAFWKQQFANDHKPFGAIVQASDPYPMQSNGHA